MMSPPEITSVLEAEAREVEIGNPPTAALVARGHLAVRQRRVRGLAAVAVAALVVGVVSVVGPNLTRKPDVANQDHPSSVADLPTGMAPLVPYFDGLDLVTTEGRHTRVINHPRLVLTPDLVVYSGAIAPGIQFSRYDGSGVGAVNGSDPSNRTSNPVAVSANGRWAAAAYYTDASPVSVQLFDLRAQRPVAIASFKAPANVCCSAFGIAGIDNGGSIYALGSEAGSASRLNYWRWDRTTGRMTRLHGLGGVITSVRGDGSLVVSLTAGGVDRSVLGTLDATGTFQPGATVSGQLVTWSSDGSKVVHVATDGEVQVRSGSHETRMRLPADARVRTLVWEEDDELLLRVADTHGLGWVLRCRAIDGRCEIALRGAGSGTTLPVRP